MKKTITYFSAIPEANEQQTEYEFDEIKEKVGNSDSDFNLVSHFAIQPNNLLFSLLKHKPNVYLFHFSGQGTEKGIVTKNHNGSVIINDRDLDELFETLSTEIKIDCAIFNRCMSKNIGASVGKYVPYVLGSSNHTTPQDAINFSIGFYEGLALNAKIETCFRLGRTTMRLAGNFERDEETPLLFFKNQNLSMETPSLTNKQLPGFDDIPAFNSQIQSRLEESNRQVHRIEQDLSPRSQYHDAATWLLNNLDHIADYIAAQIIVGSDTSIIKRYAFEIKLFLEQIHGCLVAQRLNLAKRNLVMTKLASKFYEDGLHLFKAIAEKNENNFNKLTVAFLLESTNCLIEQLN